MFFHVPETSLSASHFCFCFCFLCCFIPSNEVRRRKSSTSGADGAVHFAACSAPLPVSARGSQQRPVARRTDRRCVRDERSAAAAVQCSAVQCSACSCTRARAYGGEQWMTQRGSGVSKCGSQCHNRPPNAHRSKSHRDGFALAHRCPQIHPLLTCNQSRSNPHHKLRTRVHTSLAAVPGTPCQPQRSMNAPGGKPEQQGGECALQRSQ